jgi:hypothetical protein
VKLWDSASGQELRTLKGHTAPVWSVAFSRDGTRLASASNDGTVKLWDSASGQELRTLKGHGTVWSVAFSPDGTRLAAGCNDGTVKMWDARPLTPDVQVEREALGLLEFLFSKSLVKAQVVENLRSNKTISGPVREKALAFVDLYWKAVVYRQANRLVDSLFAEPMIKADAIERVRNNHALSEEVRQEALALAESLPVGAYSYNKASWAVVSKPGMDASAYRSALRPAEEACRLVPDNGLYLTTLGVAQYRVGRYQQALESLLRSEKLNAAELKSSQQRSVAPVFLRPADLASISTEPYFPIIFGHFSQGVPGISRLVRG